MTTMTILQSLLNAGIHGRDAAILEQEYAAQDPVEFLEGLEEIARVLAYNDPPTKAPIGAEPWAAIQSEMLSGKHGDNNAAYTTALANEPTQAQVAISGAISLRIIELQKWRLKTGKKKHTTKDFIKALNRLGYRFRYNTCTYNIECNGDPISDMLASEISNHMLDAGFGPKYRIEDAYFEAANTNRYHPIRDYLMDLVWDGHTHIDDLASYFVDEHGVFGMWLRRWMIGACARVMAYEQNRLFVLDGVQRLGKDYFVKWLTSPMKPYYHEGPISPDDKDHRLRLLSVWVWNASEIGNTVRKADREALKAFLTLQDMRERKPYGRHDIVGPVITSFFGTVNNESGVLSDPTGNRRYMISHLLKIDWSYTKNLRCDDLWAEAMAAYLNGESQELTPQELQLAHAINVEYEVVDIVEETVKEYFDIDPDNKTWFTSTRDLIEVLKNPLQGNLRPSEGASTRRLAGALTSLGLGKPIRQTIKGKQIRGYFGIRLRMP